MRSSIEWVCDMAGQASGQSDRQIGRSLPPRAALFGLELLALSRQESRLAPDCGQDLAPRGRHSQVADVGADLEPTHRNAFRSEYDGTA